MTERTQPPVTPPQTMERLEDILAESELLRRKKDYEAGIRLLGEALAHHAGNADIYYRLGNLYIDQGDLEYAERAYVQAVECDPAHANALNNLAVVYKRRGNVRLFVQTIKRSRKASLHHAQDDARRKRTGNREASRIAKAIPWIVSIAVVALLLLFVFNR